MFNWTSKANTSKATGCAEYSARLEERLESASQGSTVRGTPETNLRENSSVPADRELEAHLLECAGCRQALEDAALGARLIRDGNISTAQPFVARSADAFAGRVMRSIREESLRRAGGLWRPLELLGSRFALAAAVLLLGVSVYLAEFAPPFHTPAMNSQTSAQTIASQDETNQAEIGAGLPEPPTQPSGEDEVLTSLAERTDDF